MGAVKSAPLIFMEVFMLTNAYQSLYNLISTAVFGGDPSIATYGEFMCEFVTVIACSFLIALPFIVLWRIIRRFL